MFDEPFWDTPERGRLSGVADISLSVLIALLWVPLVLSYVQLLPAVLGAAMFRRDPLS